MGTKTPGGNGPCWKEYRLHIAVLIVVVVSELVIRKQTITISNVSRK